MVLETLADGAAGMVAKIYFTAPNGWLKRFEKAHQQYFQIRSYASRSWCGPVDRYVFGS